MTFEVMATRNGDMFTCAVPTDIPSIPEGQGRGGGCVGGGVCVFGGGGTRRRKRGCVGKGV